MEHHAFLGYTKKHNYRNTESIFKNSWVLFGICLVIFFLMNIHSLNAQTFSIKGKVVDAKDNSSIPGVAVRLYLFNDTVNVIGTITDTSGAFQLTNISKASYRLKLSSIGYNAFEQVVVVVSDIDLASIKIQQNTKQLKEVVVESLQERVEQKGDTTQFNAGAYKTHQDATAEDLVKKFPGVTSDGNGIKVNGEDVKKVLVDGKPFFGEDPNAALKNLPASIIDKVQVYDKASDQSQFTGFKDGDEQKAINIITKEGKNVGQFGKVYAGYGIDNKYNGGLTFNSFDSKRRISVIGMSNNINQQNFSISDIMSVMSNSGAQGGQGMNGPPAGAGNFFSGQQSGITNTTAAGLNYSDMWGKKMNVSGSYFFNHTDNTNESNSVRNYFIDNSPIYSQTGISKTKNQNHKANFKLEYTIDSVNSLIITPRFTFQKNNSTSNVTGSNAIKESGLFLSQTTNKTLANNVGYDFQNDLLLQHKFQKKGRTISMNINTQISNREGDGSYYSSSENNDTLFDSTVLDQKYETASTSKTWGGRLSYTEPIGENGQVVFSYNPSYTQSNSDKITNNSNGSSDYSILDTSLSNTFNNTYTSQRGGIGYRINKGKTNFMIGADIEQATLIGKQTFPTVYKISRTFTNVLPTAMLSYKIGMGKNLNVTYRTAAKSPTAAQLQNVLDVSNPLLVKSGNADLRSTIENNLVIRLGLGTPMKAKNMFVFLMANQTNNYISNATYLVNSDTSIQGYSIGRGSQFSKPVNLNNYYSLKAFGVYSFPLTFIKSNSNINGGYTYSHTPALINDKLNYSNNNAINAGVYLSSNISQALDFSIAYNGSYNTVTNTTLKQSNNTYFNHTATLKANYILLKKIVFNTDVNQIYYTGLTQSYNQNFILWNGSVGYKFLKNQSLEAKVSVYDILNQNRSISRTITESYSEDSSTNALKRYLMFTLTYTFKHFKNGSTAPEQIQFPKGMPPPGNMPPPGGAFPPPGN